MSPKKRKQTGRQRLRNFRRNVRSDTPEGKNARIYLGATIVIIGLLTAVMINAPWAGGWEITSSLDKVIIEGKTFTTTNLHEFDVDIDGKWIDWVNETGDIWDYDNNELSDPMRWGFPEVEVSTSYPYYINRLADGTWVKTDNPAPIDEYNITIATNATQRTIQTYKHWTIGIDVTIETEAEKFEKPFPAYPDYGWFYEAKVAEVDVWLDCSVTPWVAVGSSGNWTVIDGWSGIMSASVFNYEYGKVDEDAAENYGHTIQGLEQKGQALNMDHTQTIFDNPSGIVGVPTSLSTELSIDLGAGADYTTDWFGHWTSVAVRNVFVEYNVRFDIVTTLIWQLNLGHQDDMSDPDEDNTHYPPEITPWEEFLEDFNAFFQGPMFQIVVIVIIIIGGIVLYKLLSRGDNQ